WMLTPGKAGIQIQINRDQVSDQQIYVNPGDKIRIGSTMLEITTPIVREWSAVSQVYSRLDELSRTVKMQARTLEHAIQENFPSAKGTHDWNKMFLDVFAMVDRSLNDLRQTCDTLRQIVPSMETVQTDNIILTQALRTSRRSNNLANY